MGGMALTISRRESEVLEALGRRMTNAEIAAELHLTVRTVESHVSALLRKLQVPNRRGSSALATSLLLPRPALSRCSQECCQ
jgi:DNA-binding NarL/FixJ family response regulator